jgi:peroxiredoxin
MNNSEDLFDKLRRCAEDAPEWQELYDDFVTRLVQLEAGREAPPLGSAFPCLSLPDFRGRYVALADLYDRSPIVLSFNRGSWCPYCTHELESWRDALPELKRIRGRLVVVVGEVGGRAQDIAEMMGDEVDVLCDVDHGAALDLGLAFHVSNQLMDRYRECGLHLAEIYGTNSGILPIPATFIIDGDGTVRFAFADPDFRVRAEPRDVLAQLASLAG